MDDRRFDALTRALAGGASRRGLLKGIAAGAVAGVAGLVGRRRAVAATPCSSWRECPSRRCVDGYCCDSACAGRCEACNALGLEGICSAVAGTPVGDRPACPGSGPCQGVCDGQNRTSCVTPVGGVCGAPTCSGGFFTTYACAANGTCAPTTTSCAPFGCTPDGAACATGCQDHDECGAGNACVNDACVPLGGLGASCGDGEECQSGICAQGVCCASACAGACQSCNVAGNEGFCTEIADGESCDGGACCDGECVDTGASLEHCGACDHNCPPPPANATAVCADSTCDFVCNAEFTECGGAGCCDDATQACDEQTGACCTTEASPCGGPSDAPCCGALFCLNDVCTSNTPPVADSQSGLEVDRDATLTITLTGSDPDGDSLTFAIVTPPTKGALGTITPVDATSATVVYTPGPDAEDLGADSFTFTVNDGIVDSVAATVALTVNDIPVDVTYATLGNTELVAGGATPRGFPTIADPDGVLAGLSGLTVTSTGAITTLRQGEVTMNADGSFSYLPPAGNPVPFDQFAFEVSTGRAAIVNLTQTGMVWYVNNAAPAGGDGRSHAPFQEPGVAAATALPGQTIFVFAGNSAVTPYGTVTLNNGQVLLGEGVGLTVAPFGELVSAGERPVLSVGGASVVHLAQDNTLRGVDLVGIEAATEVLTGNGFGTATIDQVSVTGTGQALFLFNGTLAATFDQIGSANAAGNGILLSAVSGTLTVTNGVTITTPGLGGISFQESSLDADFGATTIATPGETGIFLRNNTGTAAFGNLDVTTDNVPAIVANTFGTLSATGGDVAVSLSEVVISFAAGTLDLTLDSLISTDSNNRGIFLINVGGTLAITGGAITGANGPSVEILGGDGTITYGGSITTFEGNSVIVRNRTGGAVTLSGNIDDRGAGMILSDNSGGSITFSGVSKFFQTENSTAIRLEDNAGATIAFPNGGLAITTTSGDGIRAAGGAAGITVTGPGNVITTETGTALFVENTTIGAEGLVFERISAGADAGGPASGIVLQSTGALGGLTVTGTGSAGSGGLIRNVSDDGVSLVDVQHASLAWMEITGTTLDGILAENVRSLSVANSSLTDVGGSGIVDGSSSSVTATFSITGNTLTNLSNYGVGVGSSGDATAVGTISGNAITNANESSIFLGVNIGVLRAVVRDNVLRKHRRAGVHALARGPVDGLLALQLEGNSIESEFAGAFGAFFLVENDYTLCLDVQDVAPLGTNNTSAGAGAAPGYTLRQSVNSVFQLEGFTTGGDVAAFFAAENNVGSVETSGTIVGGTCDTP